MKAPQVLTKLLKTVVTFLGTRRYFSMVVHKILIFNQFSGSSVWANESTSSFYKGTQVVSR